MSTRSSRSYDEIIARTVPDPDGSWRPTPQQVRDTREGRTRFPDDEALAAQVGVALRRAGAIHVVYEIDDGRVTLRGAVPDLHMLHRIEEALRAVAGIEELDDRVHVEAPFA